MKDLLVFACSQDIVGVPKLIKLLPIGTVKCQHGTFIVDAESFDVMCKSFVGRGIDIVIDYEHQTLKDVQAPAGGWIKELVLSDGAICGRVEWTPKAAEYLKNGEYRYLSPVVLVRGTDKKALVLKSCALTNTPAIDNMFPIINSEKFEFEKGDSSMELLIKLIALLGLGDGATEADVLAAIQKLLDSTATETVANKTIMSLLSLKDGSSTAEVAAKISTLQNPANFVPIEQYNLVANKLGAIQTTDLVEQALKDGKITPAQRSWAEQYILSDKSGFEKFLEMAVPVVPMTKIAPPPNAKSEKKPEVDTFILKSLGITADDLAKYGKDEQ